MFNIHQNVQDPRRISTSTKVYNGTKKLNIHHDSFSAPSKMFNIHEDNIQRDITHSCLIQDFACPGPGPSLLMESLDILQ